MPTWNDLPFELQEDILKLCIFGIDDPLFRSWVKKDLADFYGESKGIQPKYDVMEYIKEHSQEQFSIMEKIFIVCKTWSENLVPSLERHLQDVQEYSRRFLIEIEDLPYEPPDDSSSCPCCWEFSPRTDCFDEWEDYVLHRKEYAERLLLNFRDFVNDARERDANFAPAKGPDDETTGSQEMEMVIREKKC